MLPKRLKAAMLNAGINQIGLARMTDISKASISQYASGKNQPSSLVLDKLANALNVSADFLNGTDEDLNTAQVNTPEKITPNQAARCMGKNVQFVREGLKRGILPFGCAVPGTGERFSYYISPKKFKEYIGEEAFNRFFNISA